MKQELNALARELVKANEQAQRTFGTEGDFDFVETKFVEALEKAGCHYKCSLTCKPCDTCREARDIIAPLY